MSDDVVVDLRWEAEERAAWKNLAACAETDPEIFFPDKGGSAQPAKSVCAGCEVSAQCLADAVSRGETWGIWGGRTAHERRGLSKPRRAGKS